MAHLGEEQEEKRRLLHGFTPGNASLSPGIASHSHARHPTSIYVQAQHINKINYKTQIEFTQRTCFRSTCSLSKQVVILEMSVEEP